MEFRGQLYNSLEDWNTANDLAHKLCSISDKYTSTDYANPIETTDNKFILVELKGFESILKDFNFVTLKKSIIKVNELE
tara:strand:+ start:143 stop:379 length:237 start_codon:yes stop_codon:yes gene_type:complete